MSTHRVTQVLRTLAVAIAVASTAACGAGRRGVNSSAPPAFLYFSNESQDQAEVYAVVSGNQRVRLGTVYSNRTETLKVPGDIAARGANVSLVARLLAKNFSPSTGPIAIRPGDRLSVRLPADQRQLVILPGQP